MVSVSDPVAEAFPLGSEFLLPFGLRLRVYKIKIQKYSLDYIYQSVGH